MKVVNICAPKTRKHDIKVTFKINTECNICRTGYQSHIHSHKDTQSHVHTRPTCNTHTHTHTYHIPASNKYSHTHVTCRTHTHTHKLPPHITKYRPIHTTYTPLHTHTHTHTRRLDKRKRASTLDTRSYTRKYRDPVTTGLSGLFVTRAMFNKCYRTQNK